MLKKDFGSVTYLQMIKNVQQTTRLVSNQKSKTLCARLWSDTLRAGYVARKQVNDLIAKATTCLLLARTSHTPLPRIVHTARARRQNSTLSGTIDNLKPENWCHPSRCGFVKSTRLTLSRGSGTNVGAAPPFLCPNLFFSPTGIKLNIFVETAHRISQ